MKKYLFLVVVLGLAAQVFGQQASASVSGAIITWEKTTHDFGDIVQGDRVEYTYKFTNTGTEPLLITNINVQCGCTTPTWSRDPVPPGGKSEITVGFNSAGKSGMQNKVITLVSNATNAEGTKVSFTTNVLEKKNPQ